MITTLLHTLFARDHLLATTVAAMLAGFLLAALISPFDSRTITGINPWIKPMKFLLSIGIFTATIAWLMPELRPAPRARAWIARVVASTMLIEVICIAGQAARGTTSHFNVSSVFDARVFDLMGLAITMNTLAVAAMIPLLRREVPPQRAGYLWGVRLGLGLFVAGSLLGFVIVTNQSHSVPGPDSGLGLPFINWSIDRGDLRVAHFVGLHALQALPLLGYVLDSSAVRPSARTRIVSAVAAVWALVVAGSLAQALAGRPFLPLN